MRAFVTLFRDLLGVLPPRASRFIVGYAVALAALAVLDAVSLALLALVISPLVSDSAVTIPVIGPVEGVGLVLVIGIVCVLVLAKGFCSVLLLWIATRRFATFELAIGARLFDSYVESSWVERLRRNSADLVRLVDGSIAVTVSAVLLPGAGLVGELVTFLTVVVVLAIAQPLVAAIALVYLGLIGALLFFWVTRKARQAGRVNLRYSLRVSRLITEMVGALKEITLRGKTAEVAAVVRENRVHTSRARSNTQFLAQVPRYVLETAIIGGFVLVGVAGYLTGGLTAALTAVALFSLAGFRMAPSLIRFQNVVSLITTNTPQARRVIDEIRRSERSSAERRSRPVRELATDPRELEFRDVAFRYSPDAPPAVDGVSLTIPFGATVAFVGASGAGKSTVVDLLLGLIEPTAGYVGIDGVPLTDLTASWRSRVAYVPQDVALFDSTVAQNVALTWRDDVDRERVEHALEQAQVLDVVRARAGGVDGVIGERGLALSGGQRQRIGIARALYTDPLVLVMDEATSALDTATEAAVSEAIRRLRGKVTIVTVAHRLSTVMHADRIFFLSGGRLAAQGTFAELVATVPEFAEQAGLAGLTGPE